MRGVRKDFRVLEEVFDLLVRFGRIPVVGQFDLAFEGAEEFRARTFCGRPSYCIHCFPLLFAWNAHLSAPGTENALAVRMPLLYGSRFHENEAHRRLAGARELHLFAGVDGGEDVGEVLLRVLGADLHGFRVVERGCGVNP